MNSFLGYMLVISTYLYVLVRLITYTSAYEYLYLIVVPKSILLFKTLISQLYIFVCIVQIYYLYNCWWYLWLFKLDGNDARWCSIDWLEIWKYGNMDKFLTQGIPLAGVSGQNVSVYSSTWDLKTCHDLGFHVMFLMLPHVKMLLFSVWGCRGSKAHIVLLLAIKIGSSSSTRIFTFPDLMA